MSHRTCKIDGCEGRVKGRGWCSKHYERWRVHGDPSIGRKPAQAGECSVPGCDKQMRSLKLCPTHYNTFRIHGDPLGGQRKYSTPEEAFAARSEWQGDCLIWTGGTDSSGYGHLRVNGKQVGAHRYAWERANGTIPAGLVIDHWVCFNPLCVNVAHLRVVTRRENCENKVGVRSDNKSTGVRGVTLDGKSYLARVMKNGKYASVGSFKTVEEADMVVREARLKYYTHSEKDKRWKAAQANGGDRFRPANP